MTSYFENALVREGPVRVSLPEPPRSCRYRVILRNARVRRVREGWASTAGRRRPASLGETYGASSSAASGFSVSLGFSKQSRRGVGAGSLGTDPLPAPTPHQDSSLYRGAAEKEPHNVDLRPGLWGTQNAQGLGSHDVITVPGETACPPSLSLAPGACQAERFLVFFSRARPSNVPSDQNIQAKCHRRSHSLCAKCSSIPPKGPAVLTRKPQRPRE